MNWAEIVGLLLMLVVDGLVLGGLVYRVWGTPRTAKPPVALSEDLARQRIAQFRATPNPPTPPVTAQPIVRVLNSDLISH